MTTLTRFNDYTDMRRYTQDQIKVLLRLLRFREIKLRRFLKIVFGDYFEMPDGKITYINLDEKTRMLCLITAEK